MDRRAYRLLFALILVLRVAVCAQPAATFDAISYAIVGDAVSSGHDVYAATNRYNYSPVWSFVLAALWRLGGGELMRFIVFVGLLLNAVDAAAATLLVRIGQGVLRLGPDVSRRLALLFLSNPISVIVTCYLRQFDGIAMALLLVAVLAASKETVRGRWTASIALSASLLVKHITALHPLVFWRRRHAGLPAVLVALPYAVFALSFVPYLSSFGAIRDNVFLYGTGLAGSRGQRAGGLQTILAAGAGNRYIFFGLFLAVVGGALWLGRRAPLPRACLLLSLAALAGAPGFAAQYLVWPVALGSLYPSLGYALLTTLGALFMVSEARLLPLPIVVPVAGAWVGAFVWLLLETRAVLEERVYDDGIAERLQTSSTPSF